MLSNLRGALSLAKSGIEELRALPYKKGHYASRAWGHPFHRFVSYPSKLKPSIAHFLVQLFTRPGEKVLDPFSGVGTIPFEASLQGRIGIGADLGPIGFHATRAKVSPPAQSEVEIALHTLRNFIDSNKRRFTAADAEKELLDYYHPETLLELLSAREYFASADSDADSFVLASLLHILHGNRPYALSRRSHNIMPWPPRGEFVYKSVADYTAVKARRMASRPLPPTFQRGKSLLADVTKVPIDTGAIDAILTSPPFHGNRDFLRMNRIRLWCAGWDYEFQQTMKEKFFEHQKDMSLYHAAFQEFRRILKPAGVCVMHLGIVNQLDMAAKLKPMAAEQGFRVLDIVNEDTSTLESHGIRDRGATRTHQFLVMTSE